MRKLKIVVGVMSLLLLLQFTLVAPVSGITNGDPDTGNLYPSVGALKVVYEDGTQEYLCSGVLISPTAFLMTGLCMRYVNSNPDWKGYISFDNQININDLGEGNWIPIISSEIYWTTLNSGNGGGGFHWFSIAILPEGSTAGITPAILTQLGLLDEQSAQGGLRGVEFTSVGYGDQADWEQGPPRRTWNGWRNFSSAPFQALTPEYLELNINEHATGGGGACWGDVAAPLFWLDDYGQYVLVGLAPLAGMQKHCRSTAGYWRLDTPWAQEFLSEYVE